MCIGKLLVENTSKTETVAFKVKTNNQKRCDHPEYLRVGRLQGIENFATGVLSVACL